MMMFNGVWLWARIALCAWVLQAFSVMLFARMPAACKASAELQKAIATQPSAGVYDALGAYFGQRQQLSCAIAAFEAAVHQDSNSWEARFNLSLALLQKHEPAKAARGLKITVRVKRADPVGHIALGEARGERHVLSDWRLCTRRSRSNDRWLKSYGKHYGWAETLM